MSSRTQISLAKVRQVVTDTLPRSELARAGEVIFGPGGTLDSLGLVNFLADLEYRIDQEFDREVVLASDKAMSRKRSPFRDVDALTDYLMEILAE